jgi:hypothetical protein
VETQTETKKTPGNGFDLGTFNLKTILALDPSVYLGLALIVILIIVGIIAAIAIKKA